MRRMISAGPPAKRPPHSEFGRGGARAGGSSLAVDRTRAESGRLLASLRHGLRRAPARSWRRRRWRPSQTSNSASLSRPRRRTRRRQLSLPPISPASTVGSRRFRGQARPASIFGPPGASPACSEMPSLERLQSRLGDRIAVLGGFRGPRRQARSSSRSSPSSGSNRSRSISIRKARSGTPSRCAGCRPAC